MMTVVTDDKKGAGCSSVGSQSFRRRVLGRLRSWRRRVRWMTCSPRLMPARSSS